MNYPFISVIMSVYNSEKYLSLAIESILNQTYSNFEFIIINDGSSDSSTEIIKKYQQKDSRIVLIDQKNMGLTKSLNKGINVAKGDYIARMDSDDISKPLRFKNFLDYIELHKNVMIYTTPAIIIDSFGNSVRKIPSYTRRNGFNPRMLDYTNSLIHGTLIINSDLLKKTQYDEGYRFAQDFNLYHRLIFNGFKINYDKNNISYLLRVHNNQVTNTNSVIQNKLYYKTLNEFNKKIYKFNIINRILFKFFDMYFYVKTKLDL